MELLGGGGGGREGGGKEEEESKCVLLFHAPTDNVCTGQHSCERHLRVRDSSSRGET